MVYAAGYPAWKKEMGAGVAVQVKAAGHFKSAVNMPTDVLEAKVDTLPSDKPIVFVCSTGARSGEAFYMLQDLRPELKKVYYLEAEATFEKDGTYTIKKPGS